MKTIEENNAELLRRLPGIVLEPALSQSATPPQPSKASMTNADNLVIAILEFLHKNLSRGIGVAQGSKEFRYRGCTLTREKYEDALKGMQSDKLCDCIEYRRTAKGSATHMYIPSPNGYDLLGNPPDLCVANAGAGVKQPVLQRVISHHFLTAHHVVFVPHMRRNGKTPDGGFEHSGRLCAMELSITTEAKHEAQNAVKNIAAGFDYSISVFMTKKHGITAEAVFAADLDPAIKSKIKIAELWQVFSCTDLSQLYAYPGLTVSLPPQLPKGSTL